ncbi:MAG: ABC transporter permease subunit, partial [Bacilli bacterium]
EEARLRILADYRNRLIELNGDYEKEKNTLLNEHRQTPKKEFKKEKLALIAGLNARIEAERKLMREKQARDADKVRKLYLDYLNVKKDAQAKIKEIRLEARETVRRMSPEERNLYKQLQKYIREDFRLRKLKRMDSLEAKIFKRINPAYIYVAPAFLGAVLFTLLPFIFMIVGSFFRIDFANMRRSRFVGLSNFINIFTKDTEFQKALGNTAIYALITIVLLTVVTVGMAAWLAKNTRIHNLTQTMVFTPHIASLVSISILWIAMLNPTGIINQFLALFGIKGPAWLLQENTSLFSVSLVTVWKDIGYYVLIIISGLQGIPAYVYEAALLDKAGKTTTFFKITLPLLAPTMSFVFLTKFINSFKVFAPIEIMTNGGPMGSSMVLSYWIYKVGRIGFNYGTAMAGAIILTLMIAVCTLLKNLYFDRVVEKAINY